MAISAADFAYIQKLLLERSAIVLAGGKEYLAESRLGPVARDEGFGTIDRLVAHLRPLAFNGLHQKVVEALTTNETSFFRDVVPFKALQHLIPLIQTKRADRCLTVWSAACSSGQEPYSIVITLREEFAELIAPRLRILATDLSTEMVGRAQKATYTQIEVERGLAPALRAKYFERHGSGWQVKEALRRQIEFRAMNLIDPWPSLPQFDIVFLRNVLIYFDLSTKKEVFAKLRRVLAPHGVVFLGSSETTHNVDDAFERVEFEKATCYRLRGCG
ncbi:MAG: protein-glutamate O-methyltransferase CheR [Myxococcales bacterium]